MAIDLTGLGSVFDFGSKLIDKVWPDKMAQESERAKAQLALIQMNQSGELEEIKEQLSAIITEAQSADPWTSRARPSFLYVVYLFILFAIPIGILSVFNLAAATAIASGSKAWLSSIPDAIINLFGMGYLGYTGARTFDKWKGSK
ncbi:MAG TPA: holin family protein [Methanosarcina sp.]|nr:holin family protein [Methanosarcina sp.]